MWNISLWTKFQILRAAVLVYMIYEMLVVRETGLYLKLVPYHIHLFLALELMHEMSLTVNAGYNEQHGTFEKCLL